MHLSWTLYITIEFKDFSLNSMYITLLPVSTVFHNIALRGELQIK